MGSASPAVPGASPARNLLRMLLVREWRAPSISPFLLAGFALAATAGWSAAALGDAGELPSGSWYAPPQLARYFGGYAAGLFAVLGALTCINRVADDHADRWLIPLVSLVGGRQRYPACVYASAVSVFLSAHLVCVTAFCLALALQGQPSLRQWLQWMVGGGGSIVSTCAFGLGMGLLVRTRMGAVLAALGALVIPFLLSLVSVVRTDSLPPAWLHRLIFIHLPPLSHSTAVSVLLKQVGYAMAVLLLMRYGADRLVARDR